MALRLLRKPRIAHPLVDWSKEYVDPRGRRVIDLTCVTCGEPRTRTAAQVANAIRNGKFKGFCDKHRPTLRERRPHKPFGGPGVTDQFRNSERRGARIVQVLVRCIDCGAERWKTPSDIRVQIRRQQWTGRCRPCSSRASGEERACVERSIDNNGYVMLRRSAIAPEDLHLFNAMINQKGAVLEHRFVVAKDLGRPLWREEVVHHKNGRRADNRRINLELLTVDTHHGAHGDVYYEKWQQAEMEIQRLKALLTERH